MSTFACCVSGREKKRRCFFICAVVSVCVFYEGREQSQFLFAFGGEMSCVVAVGRNNRRPLNGF